MKKTCRINISYEKQKCKCPGRFGQLVETFSISSVCGVRCQHPQNILLAKRRYPSPMHLLKKMEALEKHVLFVKETEAAENPVPFMKETEALDKLTPSVKGIEAPEKCHLLSKERWRWKAQIHTWERDPIVAHHPSMYEKDESEGEHRNENNENK